MQNAGLDEAQVRIKIAGRKTKNPQYADDTTFMADAEAEAPILWPPDGKSWLIRKYPDAGKDWRQEEKGVTEDKTVGLHHQITKHEIEQAPGDGEGQGSLAATVHGVPELDMTEWLNNTTNVK